MIHLIFGVLFFATLIYFSLALFTRTDPDQTQIPTDRKLLRNKVYKVCGYTMIVCVVFIAIFKLLPEEAVAPIANLNPVFWLEAIAVVMFGISWFIKGETLLKDTSKG